MFKYRLIDEGSYDLGDLAGRQNLAATIRAAGHQRLLEWAERQVTAERLSDIFAL